MNDGNMVDQTDHLSLGIRHKPAAPLLPSQDRRVDAEPANDPQSHPLQLQLLGPLVVWRNGAAQALPPSRKVRGLLAYLVLTPRAVTRDHLCEMFWSLSDTPRSELRWCLSKLRTVLDEPGRNRVLANREMVRLDLSDVKVDVLDVQRACQAGLAHLNTAALQSLHAQFDGDFLEGLTIERSMPFSTWLLAQRRSLRSTRISILDHLLRTLPDGSDEAIACLETWLQLEPLEQRVHEMLLSMLARRGRLREGEEHLAAVTRHFEAEGLNWRPLQRAWSSLRSTPSTATATASLAAG